MTTPDYHQFITSLLAHDIANYNQTSRGYLEMLLEEQMGPLTDEQARVLVICLRQSIQIQNLIDSVRLIGELATTETKLEPVDLDETIRDVIQRVQTEFADREIRVQFIPAGRQALGQADQMAIVFRHLIGNAVRHNDAEIVEVDIQISAIDSPEPIWQISIKDNGDGVPMIRRQEMFNRLANHNIHGSGLGLSVVKMLVSRFGGNVWLEPSDPGQGATFTLTLRRA